ncbi:outer membrane protein [Erythromicrobium ramosum]|uniref:Outer membrane protein n=1 Tax=Erythrobacter ramosus TaxID=35811 RepID=A0A6I4ULZ1_9SPHN|nr:MipA/OmpV family protein [Erythrobacter ramosus]MBB3776351.1 outer membrane protein [Erythrobacter ramosus]MXP38567.1 hypothetical protein [Erythrobacter ramosus]
MRISEIQRLSAQGSIGLILCIMPSVACAEDVNVGFGFGVAPSYLGGSDYIIVPLPSVSVSSGPVIVRTNNLGLEAGIEITPTLTIGAIGRVDPGRNSLFNVRDAVVQKLRKVSPSVELGGFVEFRLPLNGNNEPGATLFTRIAAEKGLEGGHGGLLIESSMGVFAPLGARTSFAASAFLNWQDQRYANSFFSVDAEDARASGLTAFAARSGVRDIGVSVLFDRQIGGSWSAGFVSSLGRLQSSASASPIVMQRGSATQLFGGFTISRRF